MSFSVQNDISLSDHVFSIDFNKALVHQVVVSYLSSARSSSSFQKTRAEVRGGGRKPWRQKGTGRARAGSIRSPIWRGGGKVFGETSTCYFKKVNKKMYRGAMRSIFSELNRRGKLKIIDSFEQNSISTQDFKSTLKKMDLQGSVLLIDSNVNENIYLSSRNIPCVYYGTVVDLNPYILSCVDQVLLSKEALKDVEKMYAGV